MLLNIQSRINAFLKGTLNHFSCSLPEKTGSVSDALQRLLFSKVKLSVEIETVLKELPEDALIVFTTKEKSYLEFLCYATCFRSRGIPYPQIGFEYHLLWWQPLGRLFRIWLAHLIYFFKHWRFQDPYQSGYLASELLKGRPACLPLVEKGDYYRRFVKAGIDPIRHLIEIQRRTDRPVVMVPLAMFFSNKPPSGKPKLTDILFGSIQKPGRLRRLMILLRKPRNIFSEALGVFYLQQYLEHPDRLAQTDGNAAVALRRDLLSHLNRHRNIVIGPTLKSSEEMKQNILTSPRLQAFMERHAQRRKTSLHKLHKEANRTIDEIAAKYNPAFIRAGYGVAEWLLNGLFDEVVVDFAELNRAKRMSHKGPIIFVPCHKSHFDSLILGYLLYSHHMPTPHIFAGKNLAFWPMGPLLRRMGAFFVRRTFSGAVFYATIFSEYIYWLLKEGFNIAVFIEGTRSRSGKLLNPQLGMLSILLNAFYQTSWDDLIFMPVFIGYDRVPEETDYLEEIRGKQKESESLRQMLRARKLFKKRYGKIYLRFATPISFNAFSQQLGLKPRATTPKEHNRLCRDLAGSVFNEINRMGLVSPHAIVAGALLGAAKPSVTRENISRNIETLMTYLTSQQTGMTDSLTHDPEGAFVKAIEDYIARKILLPVRKSSSPIDKDARFRINDNKRMALEYYKNNAIAAFVPAIFTALSILEKKAFQFSSTDLHTGYTFLQELFSNEFTIDPDFPPVHLVRKNLKAFINDGIIVPHLTLPDTYNLTSQGYRKLKLFAGLIEPLLESYRVVLNYFEHFPSSYHDRKQRLKKIQSLGQRMLKRNEISRREALSIINYENAEAFFSKAGIKGSQDKALLAHYGTAIDDYLALVS
jgi:glycerol-3-phosphate O-acyltransferase